MLDFEGLNRTFGRCAFPCSNVLNSVYATIKALDMLKSPEEEAARRGKAVKDVMPFWERKKNG